MNIRAAANQALRANEKKQAKLIEEARKLREFLLALGRQRAPSRRKKTRRALKTVK